jgi:hypothetical protein
VVAKITLDELILIVQYLSGGNSPITPTRLLSPFQATNCTVLEEGTKFSPFVSAIIDEVRGCGSQICCSKTMSVSGKDIPADNWLDNYCKLKNDNQHSVTRCHEFSQATN